MFIFPFAKFENLLFLNIINILIFYIFLYFYYLLIKEIFTKNIAAYSAILISFHPAFFEISVVPMAEPLFFLLTTLSLLFVFTDKYANSKYAGFFCGLAYLTKPIALVYLIGISIYYFLSDRSRKLLPFYSFFILIASPWLIRNQLEFGNPFFSSYNFQDDFYTYSEFRHYYSGTVDSPSFLVKIYLILDSFWDYAKIFPQNAGLFLLMPFVIFGFMTNYDKSASKFCLFLIAMGNLALMSSIWATTRGSRFLLVTFLFLIPFAIDYLFSIKSSEKETLKIS